MEITLTNFQCIILLIPMAILYSWMVCGIICGIIREAKQNLEKLRMKIIVESPEEIKSMLGLALWEFEVLEGEDAYCADQEIFMDFQGKEMRIYVDKEGNLCVYTD